VQEVEEEEGGGICIGISIRVFQHQVRSIHWSPYDRVREVDADP